MNMHTYVIILLASLSHAKMTVRYGELDPGEYTECSITSNGVKYDYKKAEGREIPGLWFGLIEYDCDGTSGRLISVPACKPCGWWCNYNQYIPGCTNKKTIIVLGCLLGITLTVIGLIILNCCYKKYYQSCVNRYMAIKINKKSMKKCKKAKNMKEMGFELPPRVEEVPLQDRLPEHMIDTMRDVHVRRLIKMGIIQPMQPKTDESANAPSKQGCTNENEDNESCRLEDMARCIDEMAQRIKKGEQRNTKKTTKMRQSRQNERDHPNTRKAAILGALIASQGINVQACDNTLFLHSNGKICHDNTCQDINTYTFSMILGQTTCFKDVDNDELRMTLHETYYKTRYVSKYLTSDYDIYTESYWNCEWRGNCNSQECVPGFRYEGFQNKSDTEGYGCQTATLNCDTYCTSETKCVYYHWWLEKKGEKYPVLFKTSQIWEISLRVSYKGIEKTIKLNTNNPSSNVIGLLKYDSMKLPIVATSVMGNMLSPPSTVLVYGNQAYDVKCSDINFPENDIIGEYQVALDNRTEVYNQMHIECHTKNCASKCNGPEPTIRRFRRSVAGKRELGLNFTYIEGDQIIETKTRSFASVTLAIGNLNLLNLQVTSSYCKVAVKMTYECTGCDIMPYVVLTAYDIREQGIITFESNCTFENNYISCNPDMYKLVLTKHENDCMMYIPSTNQTLNIHFESVFLGKLDPYLKISSIESFSDSISNIAKSSDFWKSTLGSIGTMMGIGMAMTTVVKIVKIISARHAIKEVEAA